MELEPTVLSEHWSAFHFISIFSFHLLAFKYIEWLLIVMFSFHLFPFSESLKAGLFGDLKKPIKKCLCRDYKGDHTRTHCVLLFKLSHQKFGFAAKTSYFIFIYIKFDWRLLFCLVLSYPELLRMILCHQEYCLSKITKFYQRRCESFVYRKN